MLHRPDPTRDLKRSARTIDGVTRRAVTYASYLKVPELLALQVERSAGPDGAEHDELLFIVIHQVYELWFKQVRHELRRVQRALEAGDTDTALHLLNRVLKILKTLVAQVDVLETMTPLQFLSFRDRLESASGFQSAGFRQVEAMLGVARPGGGPGPTRGVRRRAGRSRRTRPARRSGIRSSATWASAAMPFPPTPPSRTSGSRRSSSRSTAATRMPRSSRSGWSTSTRGSRSGATAT